MLGEIGTLLSTGILRGFVGWAENAFEDGKITTLEYKLLAATVLRVGLLGATVYFGVNSFTDTQLDALSSGFVAILFDHVLLRLKKMQKK